MLKYIMAGCFSVLIAFGYMYGQAKHKQGYAEAEKVCSDNIAKANIKANAVLERMKNEAQAMGIPAINSGLVQLGIVRDTDS